LRRGSEVFWRRDDDSTEVESGNNSAQQLDDAAHEHTRKTMDENRRNE